MSAAAPAFMALERHGERYSGEAPELEWLDRAAEGEPSAHWWSAERSLVAPLSYRRHPSLAAACEASAGRGVPVRLRRSGGGVVPQGPGIWNLSLAYPVEPGRGFDPESAYRHLCAVLADALAGLGIVAEAQAVEGSFCDGRFNLAVGGRKICGTAQYWRRRHAFHAVLAHALLLVDADLQEATGWANDFEAALQSGRRYDPRATVTVREAGAGTEADLDLPVAEAIAAALRVPLIHRS